MDYAFLSETGNRRVNEDCAGIEESGSAVLFSVCDGLGGHAKGEIASAMAVSVLNSAFKSSSSFDDNFFPEALGAVKDALHNAAQSDPSLADTKTTVTSLLIAGDRCRWCHVGDSRIYGFKNGEITMITRDHSVPRMLVDSGEITFSDIRRHPDRNVLLRAMSTDFCTENAEYSEECDTADFDAFLLCSDGFWELINERRMCHTLHHSSSAKEWLNIMADDVRQKGRRRNMDNYTAIAVILTGKEKD